MVNRPWLDEVRHRLDSMPCHRRISGIHGRTLRSLEDLRRRAWKADGIFPAGRNRNKWPMLRVTGYRQRSFFQPTSHTDVPLTFLVFAISPVVLYTLLSFIVPLVITADPMSLGSLAAHFGPAAEGGIGPSCSCPAVPAVVAGLLYRKLAKPVQLGQQKWMVRLLFRCLPTFGGATVHVYPAYAAYVRRPNGVGEPPLLQNLQSNSARAENG